MNTPSLGKWPLPCLTIHQPWADYIKRRKKPIENRQWGCTYRGPLGIHAAKTSKHLGREELQYYQTGGIVAVANLIAIYPFGRLEAKAKENPDEIMPGTTMTYGYLAQHEFTEGPYCWVLTDVIEVQFFPCSGYRGIWKLEESGEGYED